MGERIGIVSRKTKRVIDGLRIDRLRGVGNRYEIATRDGDRLTVVVDGRGDRHINLRSGRHVDDPGASAVISPRQARLLALILSDGLQLADAAARPVSVSPPDGYAGVSRRQAVPA
jgi:K+/H+ antiporter YhaU regulatory subunit KhtT